MENHIISKCGFFAFTCDMEYHVINKDSMKERPVSEKQIIVSIHNYKYLKLIDNMEPMPYN